MMNVREPGWAGLSARGAGDAGGGDLGGSHPALPPRAVNWLDHGRNLREQGIDDNETLLLRRKFFYSDQNVDSRDPVQLNLLYVQVELFPFTFWAGVGWFGSSA